MPRDQNEYSGWIIGQTEFEEILTSIRHVPANQAFGAASAIMLRDYGWIRSEQRIVLARQLAQARRAASSFQGAGSEYRLRPSEVADSRRMQEYAANQLGRPLAPGSALWQYDVLVNVVVVRPGTGEREERSYRQFITSSVSMSRGQVERAAIDQAKSKTDKVRAYTDVGEVLEVGVNIMAVRLGY